MKKFIDLMFEETKKETDINTPEFKKWFRGSKVVDSSGKPLIVYHGTPNKFTQFREKDYGLKWKKTFWFTTDKEMAKYFSNGGNIVEVYVNIKNPKTDENDSYTTDILKKEKYDGYIGYEKDSLQIITLYTVESTQIKSIYNNGDWDKNNPNIYK